MVNEGFKEKFLTENYPNEKTRGKVERAFKLAVGPFEDEYGKDLSEFTPEEINNLFRDERSGSFRTLETMFPFYRHYAKFVEKEKGIKNDYLSSLKYNDLRKIVPEKIKQDGEKVLTKEMVLWACDTLRNPRDKVLILGLFEGISGKQFSEFIEIRPEDVHDHEVYIRSRDIYLPISDELSEFFKEAMAAETYNYTQIQRKRVVNLIKGDEIAIKVPEGKASPVVTLKTTIARVSNMCQDLGEFTVSNLKYSGMAHKIVSLVNKRMTPKRAYEINRDLLMEEYGVERIDKPRLFRMINYLLEEEEEVQNNE